MKLLEVGGFIPASLLFIPNNPICLGTAIQPKANSVFLEATSLHVLVLVGNASIAAQFCTQAYAVSKLQPLSLTPTWTHSHILIPPAKTRHCGQRESTQREQVSLKKHANVLMKKNPKTAKQFSFPFGSILH